MTVLAAWAGTSQRLGAFVETVFDTVVAVFDAAGVDLPDRRLITIGTPVHDCEEVVVTFNDLAKGGLNEEASPRCDSAVTVSLSVHVIRCFPTPPGRGSVPPAAEVLTVNAHEVMIDSWLLMDVVRVLGNDPMLMFYEVEASVAPGEPQGGYLGTVLNLQAAVP